MFDLAPGVFYADEIFTARDCDAWIRLTEELGYEPAPVSTVAGPLMMPDVRNNARVMVDDVDAASRLFERLIPAIPDRWRTVRLGDGDWDVVGLNERLRFYRYEPGQSFAMHRDGCYSRENGEKSLLTVLVYLNRPADGGATNVCTLRDVLSVEPIAGRALMFAHRLLHEGAPVIDGLKYVLRSDLMYRPSSRSEARD